jgi:membrane protein YdbS with pleckstrin-like domain
MNYQIICVCGHRFFITDQQLTGHVTCPSCGRALIPVVTPQQPANAPNPTENPSPTNSPTEPAIATTAEPTKRCPFCGEVILAIAKKCKHCGEFLDRTTPEPSTTTPPQNPLTPTPSQPQNPAIDTPVFALSVSQWDNFWKYLICLTIVILVPALLIKFAPADYAKIGVPATVVLIGFIMWFFYFSTRNSRCIIRPLRIETEVGILAKDLNSLEMFRITDLELKQGLLERLLGIGTVRITSNDPNTPELVLYQIPKARKVYHYLQQQVPIAARQRGAVYIEK